MKIINIGRGPHNDVVINDNMVSKTHCQIIQDDRGQYRLIDVNSTNGTYINGVLRRGQVVLNKTDIIKIGHETLPWQSYFGAERIEEIAVAGGSAGRMAGGIGNITDTKVGTKPDNFLVWAILATIFCCLPFGVASIVNASKVDNRWATGDYNGAINAANSAKTWFWWALGTGLFINVCYIIYCVAIGVAIGGGF
ncbi:MAG: CD225/dispanin family protein [Rikenellaceae bacterium]